MSTFRMTYRKNGVTQDYEYPAERLWEVVQRADNAFLPPETWEDRGRFEGILADDRKRREGVKRKGRSEPRRRV